ncbi:flagellar motor switch protein FliM [Alkalihalobacillus pseudalcaliphilus]|uniref:flagellar motor switch protein FliM n=1 Tax=Alkalihalobacillus pseudalcaliphilus TaxID=79884 RepID=UPI00064DF921|nr:flagellar motor switch protein FliM [Alkalihalobacillus pseudalcaliphilus]KMK77225.1 flagellar motor switch protein FliM [Alkalihalobacillus pseudalcaliphilus]
MTDVLSQGEIDALLSAISTGEMDAEELKKEELEKRIRVYDFKRALRFSKDQIRSITRIHENFARLLTTFFSAQLRTYVQISVTSVDQLPYEEFVRSIPKMTILNVFQPKPLNGRFIMEINPHIAYAMLDRLLGGKGISLNKVENLTEIETKIMSQLFQRTLDSFQDAWSSIVELEPELEDLEVNPQFLQMVSPNETVVVISLSTTIAETSGMINICLPHVVLEEILPKLSLHYWMQEKKKEREPNEFTYLESNVRKAPLLVQAELGRSSITVEEFLHLDKGDVIELNNLITEPLTVYVGGEAKFSAQPGKLKKQMAVQVTEKLEEVLSDE